jgi:glycosyltransferase involved in cell wall biosynthesis
VESPADDSPYVVTARGEVHLSSADAAVEVESPLASLAGKQVLLISHYLGITGAPLLLLETAREMRRAGARVVVSSLRDDAALSPIPGLGDEAIVPIRESLKLAAQSDLVIANTASAGPWIHDYLAEHPRGGGRLLWWLHEIDTSTYGGYVCDLDRVAAAVFDSHASREAWRSIQRTFPPVVGVVHPGIQASLLADADRPAFPYPSRGILPRRTRFRLGTRAEIRQNLGLHDADFLAALFAVYVPHKGHDLFVETAERMLAEAPELPLKVLVIGFDDERKAREFLKSFHSHPRSPLSPARVLPTVKDLRPYYAASDAFVMNTQGLGEVFGRVTIEAMAFRLPVCGTDAGGTREIVVDGETGLLHPIGAAGQEQLAANLRRLIDDRTMARQLGEAGRRRVRERFTDTRMFQALGTIFPRVIANER